MVLPFWKPILLAALAGGMGWGIRGQYGHETGAMIAGLLVSLVLVLLFCPDTPALPAGRAVAWCTVAIGFGGSMTYGQTVGLTHDPELVGHWGAILWGMLGLAVKGALWIGFAGTFLGMGLGGVRYRTREMFLLLLALLALCWLGIHLLNRPFDPAQKILPGLYFSADWHWRPEATLKPRREVWGAYLFALAGLLAYCGFVRRDALARNLGLWGVLGGALGFPLGQSLQAFHAWNRGAFQSGIWATLDPLLNWWNWMETTFGMVLGAALGLGLWLNRRHIRIRSDALSAPLPYAVEALLLSVHVTLLAAVEFTNIPVANHLYDFGLQLGFLPILVLTAGRLAPWIVMIPVVALPITGKTVRELVFEHPSLPPWAGWLVYLVLPLGVACLLAFALARRSAADQPARQVLAPALLFATLTYWGLNFGFFQYPWPWATWTARTPNALVFTICAAVLTAMAWRAMRQDPGTGAQTLSP